MEIQTEKEIENIQDVKIKDKGRKKKKKSKILSAEEEESIEAEKRTCLQIEKDWEIKV